MTKLLTIAEIRGTILGRSSSQQFIRVHGEHCRDYLFRAGPGDSMCRRYVVEGADEEKSIYPLEQAEADMKDLQRRETEGFRVAWEFITEERFLVENAAAISAKREVEEGEVERLRMLDENRKEQEQLALNRQELERPGSIPAPKADPKLRPKSKALAALPV